MKKPVIVISSILLFGIGLGLLITASAEESLIPSWIKNTAGWWSEGEVADSEFINSMKWMIENNVLKVSEPQEVSDEYIEEYKDWAHREINKYKDYSEKLKTDIDELEDRNKFLEFEVSKLEKSIISKRVEEIVNNDSMTSSQYTIKDEGDFYVTYYPNPNSIHEFSAKDWIQQTEYFEGQMEFLNSFFRLPHDVEIVIEECNVVNAFYDPATKQIIMCYEFMDSVFSDFSSYWQSEGTEMTDDELSTQNLDVVDFVFYHELGHALVDIYQLPITGLEENVVDQFASYFMLLTGDIDDYEGIFAQDIMYNVGTWYFIQSERDYEHVYWDVHNLDIQRFYNISCYAYGQNPQYNQDLITEGWLPVERAENCEYEFAVLEDSWNRILSPYYI